MEFEGEILGFTYKVNKNTVEEFEQWLEEKLTKYILKSSELKVLRKLFGISDIDTRLTNVEMRK